MQFYKYHALGNDYIVLDPKDLEMELTPARIERICHRNYGIGSDGILLGPLESAEGEFGLRIFNPDGSEAEKSGNGLRIFSRYLWDQGRIQEKTVMISTPGGLVKSRVTPDGKIVSVEMGTVTFQSRDIPVTGPSREVINEAIHIDGNELIYCAASIGNPHCVILRERAITEEAHAWGPQIETDSRFPNRINVQFMQIIDRNNIQIEIWERGAGYTLASGSSSSAAAAVARRLGHCDEIITVHMPGGNLDIEITEGYAVTMTGAVTKVLEGILSSEMLAWQ